MPIDCQLLSNNSNSSHSYYTTNVAVLTACALLTLELADNAFTSMTALTAQTVLVQ
jgi:hypothetical protein